MIWGKYTQKKDFSIFVWERPLSKRKRKENLIMLIYRVLNILFQIRLQGKA